MKKAKKANENIWRNLRIVIVGIMATMGFVIVVGHLFILQFIENKKWSEAAYKQQVKNQILSPNRGTIYDSNGEILAQSIPVDTVSLNPGKVTYSNNKKVPDEIIAKGISEIFNITYDEMIEKLSMKRSVIIIEKNENTINEEELNELSLEEHYKYYEKLGYENKDIIKQIAKDRNVQKNEIYKQFIKK